MNPTKAQKKYWTAVAELGCIACRKDGVYNPYVSIHHVDGRTKKNAHWEVLPLCANHHQGVDGYTVSVHEWKKRFELKYGTQEELMRETNDLLAELGYNWTAK